jgi:hypothetical protein
LKTEAIHAAHNSRGIVVLLDILDPYNNVLGALGGNALKHIYFVGRNDFIEFL